jgi:hypothetical protein
MSELICLRNELQEFLSKKSILENKINIYKGFKESIFAFDGLLNNAEKVILQNLNTLIFTYEMKLKELTNRIKEHNETINQLVG